TAWVFNVIAFAAIVARLNLRLHIQKRKLMWGDYLICTAGAAVLASNALNTELVRLGAYDKQVEMTLVGFHGDPEAVDEIIKYFVLSHIPLWSSFYLCKASLLAAYLTLFEEFMKKRRFFLWVTIAYNVVAYVVSLAALLFICEPERYWSLSIPGSCAINYGESIFLITWALHFFGDILVFALPWLVVPSLRLRFSVKIALYSSFLLGAVSIIICIIRLVTLETSGAGNDVSLSLMGLWNILESNISVTIACLPSLWPYFGPRESGTTGSKHSASSKKSNATPRESVLQEANKETTEVQSTHPDSGADNRTKLPPNPSSHVGNSEDEEWESRGRSRTRSDTGLVPVEPMSGVMV
ncbi:hypothetical protein B0J13DRAFT_439438, partial [Dactylonectria estremocensis]